MEKNIEEMKKYFFMAVAAIVALSSCSIESDSLDNRSGDKALVFTAAIVIGNYFRLGGLDSAALSAGPTRQFITEIKRRRVQQLRWIQIMLPLFVLWLGYFILEVMHTGRQGMDLYIIIFSLSVGAATGLFISFRTHNRIIAFYDSIIAQLELSGGGK